MMNEETFQKKLETLIAEINGSDRTRLQEIAKQTKAKHAELKTTVAQLQDSIDFVRLSIKYLLFDLEATRRENETLRNMLDSEEQ